MAGGRQHWSGATRRVAEAMRRLHERTRTRFYELRARLHGRGPLPQGINRAASGEAKPAEFMGRRLVDLAGQGLPKAHLVDLVAGHRDDLLELIDSLYVDAPQQAA